MAMRAINWRRWRKPRNGSGSKAITIRKFRFGLAAMRRPKSPSAILSSGTNRPSVQRLARLQATFTLAPVFRATGALCGGAVLWPMAIAW